MLFPLPPDCSDGGPLQFSTLDLALAMLYSVGKGNIIMVGHSAIIGNEDTPWPSRKQIGAVDNLQFLMDCISNLAGICLGETRMALDIESIIEQFVGPLVAGSGTASATQAPGGIAAVYYQGQVSYVPFGYMDESGNSPTPQTVFGIGSVTKIFTTSILGQTPELLTETVVKRPLPPGFSLSPEEQPLTYVELATFTGGFPHENPAENQAAFQTAVNNVRPAKLPAENVYSNCSIGFLGQVLMYRDGYQWTSPEQNAADADTWYKNHLFDGLSMTSTTAVVPEGTPLSKAYAYQNRAYVEVQYERWCPWGTAGRIYSTASDMINFIMANVGVATINGNPVPETIRQGLVQALTPWSPKNAQMQALAWVVTPSGVRIKNGGLTGVSSCVAVNPTQQSGVVVLLNMKNVDATGAAVSIMNAIASKP